MSAVVGINTVEEEEELEKPQAKQQRSDKFFLGVFFCLYILFGAANTVSLKLAGNFYTSRYAYFFNEGSTILYDIIALSVVTYKLWFTNDITPEMRTFPKWKFLCMALCDSSSGFMISMANPHTPGTLQTLLLQLGIPITAILSRIFLARRYQWFEIVGAVSILSGTVVALIPPLIHPASSGTKALPLSIIIYSIAMIPMSASSVIKEWALKGFVLNVFYLSTWVSWLQLLLSIGLAPLQSLPVFNGPPLDEIVSSLGDGFLCFFGQNVPGISDCDKFGTIMLLIFVFFNFGMNIVSLKILRYGSAVYGTIAVAVSLPLQNFLFALKPFGGEPLEWSDYVGLAVVVVGFAIYNKLWAAFSNDEAVQQEEDLVVVPLFSAGRPSVCPLTFRTSEARSSVASPHAALLPPAQRDVVQIRRMYLAQLGFK